MASVIERLKEARELYVKMSEAAEKLQQAALAAEQDYRRLQGETRQAAGEVEALRIEAKAARVELRSILSRHFWLILFVSLIAGLAGGLAIHFFPLR